MKVVFTCDHQSVHRHYNQTGDGDGYFNGGIQAGSGVGSFLNHLAAWYRPSLNTPVVNCYGLVVK